jgi:hypothetical protein
VPQIPEKGGRIRTAAPFRKRMIDPGTELAIGDKPSVLNSFQVSRNRRPSDTESCPDFANSKRSPLKHLQDLDAVQVGERFYHLKEALHPVLQYIVE